MALRQQAILTLAAAAAAIGACVPQATVRRTTPVADLQVYRQVLVRGSAGRMAAWQGDELASRTARYLQGMCSFDAVLVDSAGGTERRADLIVDLNLLSSGRGGGGLIQNPNLAVVEVAMVLSDGISDELLGSASIRGQSSAVQLNNATPEVQALEVVAEQIGKLLLKSGCQGPRIAREEPPPPENPEPPPPAKPEVTEEQIAEAERYNDEGKKLFRSAQVDEARSRFERAISLNPDPKYIMNLCLAHEALKQYDEAIVRCREVIDARPEPRLMQKAEQRIQLIEEKKANEA